MAGETRQRFCQSCQQHVHDLSALTRKQAEHLLEAHPKGLCGRIAFNENGKIAFQPAPENALQRMLRVSLLGISACMAHAAAAESAGTCAVEVRVADRTDAAIKGAHITFSLIDRPGPTREGFANTDGLVNQVFDSGRYRMRVESPGFDSYTRDIDLACASQTPTRLEVQMEVGGSMGQIVVVNPRPANLLLRPYYQMRNLFWRLRHMS